MLNSIKSRDMSKVYLKSIVAKNPVCLLVFLDISHGRPLGQTNNMYITEGVKFHPVQYLLYYYTYINIHTCWHCIPWSHRRRINLWSSIQGWISPEIEIYQKGPCCHGKCWAKWQSEPVLLYTGSGWWTQQKAHHLWKGKCEPPTLRIMTVSMLPTKNYLHQSIGNCINVTI